MNASERDSNRSDALPEARVTRRRLRASIIWLVPLAAALVAGFFAYDRFTALGPAITIRFQDGSGIRTGETQIKYRGVPIGKVTAIALSPDLQQVLVHARLERSAAAIARERSEFWIVRPKLELGGITGLGTVLSGPEIRVLPGGGAAATRFVGLEREPASFQGKGLRIVLHAVRHGSLRRNSPVYYRGVEVGAVREVALGSDAAVTEVRVLIRPRYANLVRRDSVFWNVSGARLSAGLLKGLDIRVESLRALVAGGIAFATPPHPAPPVRDGAVFALHADAQGPWLAWAPHIAIPEERDRPETGRSRAEARPAGANPASS